MDDLVMSLQYIIDGGGEDDIADGGRVFKTAPASRSLPEEEAKKGEEEDYEMASRSLNSPHLSNCLSIDTKSS
jgi:hypothetical protein